MARLASAVVWFTLRMLRWFVRWVSRRYVAGPQMMDAVKVMKRLSEEGNGFTIDVLGEEIATMEETIFFQQEYDRLIDVIIEHELDAHLSIKPTAFGLLLDERVATEAIATLAMRAKKNGIYLRLDMEDHRVTDATIELVLELHRRGCTNVGTVLQGRLHRTLADIERMAEILGNQADHRICKGIYLEPETIAHTDREAIRTATNAAVTMALESGAYVGIATHDRPLIDHALSELERLGMGPGRSDPRASTGKEFPGKGPGYEFQMLLGVQGRIRRRLLAEGHRTRVYLPYGEQWYEYSMRRLRENPTIAWAVMKAFLLPWTNRP